MAQRTVILWRDIPAQVLVKQGRSTAKRVLAERFERAIDRAAMHAGLTASDAYMAEWRRSDPEPCGDDLEAQAEAAATALDTAYPDERLLTLVMHDGREPGA